MAFGKLEAKEVLRSTHKSPAADVIPTFVRNTELSLNHFRRDLKTFYFRLPTWSGELVTFLGYTRARTSNLRTELTWRAWLVGEMSSYSSSALQRTVLWWTVETTAGREGGDGGATTAAWLRRMAAAVWCQRIYLVLVVGDEQWLAARGAGSSASVLAQRRLTVSLHRQEYCNSALGAGECQRAAATTGGWRTGVSSWSFLIERFIPATKVYL